MLSDFVINFINYCIGGNLMYFDKAIETMQPMEMKILQSKRLQKTILWVQEKSAFYQKRFNDVNLDLKQIKSIEDINKLPFTTKEDLIKNAPFGMLTIPMSSVIRLEPIESLAPLVMAYTSDDVRHSIEMLARCLVAGGLNISSIIQIYEDYFTPIAMGMQYAAEAIGATVVPIKVKPLEKQLEIIQKFNINYLATSPQRILHLIVAGQAFGYDFAKMPISTIFAINNMLRSPITEHLEARIGAIVFNLFSIPELIGPGIAFECIMKKGFHVNEDYFYPEVINVCTEENVGSGEMGELVLTSLTTEAMPIIRYRTGQLVQLEREICQCGRSLIRLLTP